MVGRVDARTEEYHGHTRYDGDLRNAEAEETHRRHLLRGSRIAHVVSVRPFVVIVRSRKRRPLGWTRSLTFLRRERTSPRPTRRDGALPTAVPAKRRPPLAPDNTGILADVDDERDDDVSATQSHRPCCV